MNTSQITAGIVLIIIIRLIYYIGVQKRNDKNRKSFKGDDVLPVSTLPNVDNEKVKISEPKMIREDSPNYGYKEPKSIIKDEYGGIHIAEPNVKDGLSVVIHTYVPPPFNIDIYLLDESCPIQHRADKSVLSNLIQGVKENAIKKELAQTTSIDDKPGLHGEPFTLVMEGVDGCGSHIETEEEKQIREANEYLQQLLGKKKTRLNKKKKDE